MALITALNTGFWGDAATWVGGIPPGVSDTAIISGAQIVTINSNRSVVKIQTSSTGYFTFADGGTLTCSETTSQGGIVTLSTTPSLQFTLGTLFSATFNGSILDMPSGTNYIAIQNSGGGTLNLNGDYRILTPLTSANTRTCIFHTGTGKTVITGTNNGTSYLSNVLYYRGTTLVSAYSSTTASTTLVVTNGTVDIYGIVGSSTNTSNTSVIYQTGGTINLLQASGSLPRSAMGAGVGYGIYSVGGTPGNSININGNLTGSSTAPVIYNPPLSTVAPIVNQITVNVGNISASTITAGTVYPAIHLSTTDVSDSFAAQSIVKVFANGQLVNDSTTGTMCIMSSKITTFDGITSWTFYNYPVTSPTTTSKWSVQTSTPQYPSPYDVRFNTSYNGGTQVGTCKVPIVGDVLQGVLVTPDLGRTTVPGTMLVTTPDSFWAYPTTSSFTVGSIGERLKNASTESTSGIQISSFTS